MFTIFDMDLILFYFPLLSNYVAPIYFLNFRVQILVIFMGWNDKRQFEAR